MVCEDCNKKDDEILYLKALIAVDSVSGEREWGKDTNIVEVKQQIKLLHEQLLLIRADVQYMNREVQLVISWIAKVISVFLSCCGRLGESTASLIVDSANSVSNGVSRLVFSK